MNALSSLIKSLELFLSLKNKLFYYEIREKSKNRQKEIIAEIEKLRSNGDSNSSDRADILRLELKREKSELEHLSTFYSRLQKNQKIQTLDGVYSPQADEVWHSDARFRKLEREIYYK